MKSQAVRVEEYRLEQGPDDAAVMAVASVICSLISQTGDRMVITGIKITRIS
ncbi:MAG: hypothetical protein M0Z41_11485 [Peptococcaceae bacterium]|nr:hypothetical protein [Peptococcaceae bacterium]